MRRPPQRQRHRPSCDCIICRAAAGGLTEAESIQRAHEMESEWLAKYGFYIHYVSAETGGTGSGLPANIHTHGLPESFSHFDLQIVLNVGREIALKLLHNCVNLIKDGTKFVPGVDYDKIANLPVRFIGAMECGRPVCRLIVPDRHGGRTDDDIEDALRVQFQFLETD